MTESAVSVCGLGKRYRVGTRTPYRTLRESLTGAAKAPFRLFHGQKRSPNSGDEFWALRDISFEVKFGEIVGIIGRNGAGKSTLLKVLSRITEPTSGHVDLVGRVGSLLEVGTGFHPELTGRENIFLNGSILGMSRGEIAKKFDEITAFAEVEKFLDTPVKRYSSGMYTRLAFAVAAHLEPEILLVDEVLAVGDSRFQQKCFGKIEQIGREGRTVFFVSHSMPAITRLCQRALVLEGGRLVFDSTAAAAARFYFTSGGSSPSHRTWAEAVAPGDARVRLRSVRVSGESGETSDIHDVTSSVNIEMCYELLDGSLRAVSNFQFFDEAGNLLFLSCDFNDRKWWSAKRRTGLVRVCCHIPGNLLAEGRISVLAAVTSYDPTIIHFIEYDAVSFELVDRTRGEGVRGPYVGDWPGLVRPMVPWSIEAPGYNGTALSPTSASYGSNGSP